MANLPAENKKPIARRKLQVLAAGLLLTSAIVSIIIAVIDWNGGR